MRVPAAFLILLAAACAARTRGDRLGAVRSWAIQLQGYERADAIERLSRAPCGMIVIDPARTVRGSEAFPTSEVVARLRRDRLVLAYVNVGQAESYRTYWRPSWRAPTKDAPGRPEYLITVDPDGWEGNYPVAYWDPRWRAVLWGSPDALVDEVLADGFDGVYLDWILGYEEPAVVRAARARGVDPQRAMAELVRDLRAYARRTDPRFLVVAQNGGALARTVPEYYEWIDGYAVEPLTFGGHAGVPWDDPAAGDAALPARGDWSTEALGRDIAAFRARGVPVFTIDYALDERNAERARAAARALGAVPFVTRTPLDRLPDR